MPKFCRSMKVADDGLPLVTHADRTGLGVPGPEEPTPDVSLETDGSVRQDGKGMSVFREWRKLPPGLIPLRLADRCKKAIGPNEMACFRFGPDDGTFEDGPVAPGLLLKKGKGAHGCVVPSAKMSLEEFRNRVVETRAAWQVDET